MGGMFKPRWSLITAGMVAAGLLVAPPAAAQAPAGEPIHDPIPERPIPSGLGLVVEEFASFPKSEPTPPPTDARLMRHARINHIGELPDRSGRMFVPDLNGKLYLLNKKAPPHQRTTPHEQATPRPPWVYLDVGATFAPQFFSGRGLGQGFGFATFHPDFATNGKFYTVHTEQASLATRQPDLTPQTGTLFHGIVNEWTATDPDADTFAGTRREILRIGFGGQIHGIQQIDFNPNARRGTAEYGKLYLAIGDGGLGVRNTDPQNLAMPHGKIFRIDPAGDNSANGQYGIPADNPFVGRDGALGEIYALGMRDPHRFSWDTGGRHRMFLGHIGEKTVEAIYDVTPGANLGWSEREGYWVFDRAATNPCDRLYPLPPDDERYGYTYPVAAYDHDPPPGWNCVADVGRAISGGFVYRGAKVPALRGKYLFGDIVDGRAFYTVERDMVSGARAPIHELMIYDKRTGQRVTMQQLGAEGATGSPTRVDFRYGIDRAGDLYLLAKSNGKIWKVVGTRQFAACRTTPVQVRHATDARDWAPVTPATWRFGRREVVLAEAGVERPGPRRPFEYAVLTKGPRLGSVQLTGEVRLDTPVEVTNRDVVLIFGHRSDTEFYYAHLSSDNTIYPHNGIFVVNNADRQRLDDQWDPVLSRGAPPAITDADWHDVKLRHCADTGEIAVYLDGSRFPLMTAVDRTFDSGRVGFGSFDNIGRLRDLTVQGRPAPH
jgi:glucose/sorbosone dehydrogenase